MELNASTTHKHSSTATPLPTLSIPKMSMPSSPAPSSPEPPVTPQCVLPTIPGPGGQCVNPKPQPQPTLCPDGSVVPPNGICVQLVPPPQPTPPQPAPSSLFTCPDGTQIDLSVTSQCPSPPNPSPSGPSGSSSGGGSSHSKGSSSGSSSSSSADIKAGIIQCISANVTQAITTSATMNKTQVTNATFLNKMGNSTVDCVPGLVKNVVKTTKQPTTLSTGEVLIPKIHFTHKIVLAPNSTKPCPLSINGTCYVPLKPQPTKLQNNATKPIMTIPLVPNVNATTAMANATTPGVLK